MLFDPYIHPQQEPTRNYPKKRLIGIEPNDNNGYSVNNTG